MKPFEYYTTVPNKFVVAHIIRSHAQAKARLQSMVELGILQEPVKLAILSKKRVGNKKGWSKQGWIKGSHCHQSESQIYTEEFCSALACMVSECWMSMVKE